MKSEKLLDYIKSDSEITFQSASELLTIEGYDIIKEVPLIVKELKAKYKAFDKTYRRGRNIKIIDTCGTGAGKYKTINLSTLQALEYSVGTSSSRTGQGSEVKVAKFGGHASTSKSGSMDCLEILGIKYDTDLDSISKSLDNYGISFIHAPSFYPELSKLKQHRKEYGKFSIMNLVFPLLNPLRIDQHFLGIADTQIYNLLQDNLQEFTNNLEKRNIRTNWEGTLLNTSAIELHHNVEQQTDEIFGMPTNLENSTPQQSASYILKCATDFTTYEDYRKRMGDRLVTTYPFYEFAHQVLRLITKKKNLEQTRV